MSAKEKTAHRKGCKACASRDFRKTQRKKYKLQHLLFKLDWIERTLKRRSSLNEADLLKLVKKILPKHYSSYDPLEQTALGAIHDRFPLLIKFMTYGVFWDYLGNRARPPCSGDDG